MLKFKFLLTIIIVPLSLFSQPIKKSQLTIPLSNSNGIPFFYSAELRDYYVNGFEIDDHENLYFIGGQQKITLAKFNGQHCLYRKEYSPQSGVGGSIYIDKDTIYSFSSRPTPKLSALDSKNGQIFKTYQLKMSPDINSYSFSLNGLITETYDIKKGPIYKRYSLKGQTIGNVLNKFGLSFNPNQQDEELQFIGTWGQNYVFYTTFGNHSQSKFLLTDETGQIIKSRVVVNYNEQFGQSYAENPSDHRKVKNGKLYILGHRNKLAVITTISLNDLFL